MGAGWSQKAIHQSCLRMDGVGGGELRGWRLGGQEAEVERGQDPAAPCALWLRTAGGSEGSMGGQGLHLVPYVRWLEKGGSLLDA